MRNIYVLILLALLTNCSMARSKNSSGKLSSTPNIVDPIGPRVQAHLQSDFFRRLVEGHYGSFEAWGQFSYGGWSNIGQIMIRETGPDQASMTYMAPNSDKITSITTIPKEKFSAFKASMSPLKKLSDKKVVVFDALEYEFIHLKGNGNSIEVLSRVFINSFDKNTPQDLAYVDIINAFKALAPIPDTGPKQ